MKVSVAIISVTLHIVLSDVKNTVADRFGLVYELDEQRCVQSTHNGIPKENDDRSDEIPLPGTYLAHNNEIVYSFFNAGYTKRVEPEAILDALESIRKE